MRSSPSVDVDTNPRELIGTLEVGGCACLAGDCPIRAIDPSISHRWIVSASAFIQARYRHLAPGAGLETARPQWPGDFKCLAPYSRYIPVHPTTTLTAAIMSFLLYQAAWGGTGCVTYLSLQHLPRGAGANRRCDCNGYRPNTLGGSNGAGPSPFRRYEECWRNRNTLNQVPR